MGADTLIGDSVVNGQDEDLGDIKEIMLDMRTGQVAYAVLSFGGFLGMGEKLFAVPWQALQLDTVNKRFCAQCRAQPPQERPRLRSRRLARHERPELVERSAQLLRDRSDRRRHGRRCRQRPHGQQRKRHHARPKH
ncbi:PRC-barrel domain-containing protein [Massilia sp. H-1]|nr:PRC-barrel domain-containing protein [Massilia sp. H-1]